jgi:hypothetical protein
VQVKIKQTTQTIIPKYVTNGNILTLKITDQFKYLTLPVKIIPLQIDRSNQFLIFYDGITADFANYSFTSLDQPVTDGRRASQQYDGLGARYMPYLMLSDPYYLDPTRQTGWTSGSPYDYVTKKEILGLVQCLVGQGITSTTDCYAYINWHEDSRVFLLFPASGDGYTGPANETQSQQRTILARTMASVLVGGTGSDGITFNGLKSYFPLVKWGFANHPSWPFYFDGGDVYPSNVWDISEAQKNQIMNHSADVFIRDPEFIDAIDMLMPHAYSPVNNRRFVRKHSEHVVELCKIINQKLVAQGKTPKKIIPFSSPIYLTSQTGYPYTIFNYEPVFPNHQYVPPDTIMLDSDIQYEQADPLVRSGADGTIIWLSTAYRSRQILGRPQYTTEDVPWGEAAWRRGPTAGITNPWSSKSTSRQAVSAHENYIKGICMGVTGNRWWWAGEVPGATTYTPIEWLPLSTNKAYPAAGATSGITAVEIVQRVLEDVKVRAINMFKDMVSLYSNG